MSQALKNGLDALLLVASRRSLGVTELAAELGIDKSTASRILATLQEADMVERHPDTLRYALGPTIVHLYERYHRNLSVLAVARPVMERLAAEIRESVHLGVLANDQAVIVDQVLSDSRLVVNAQVGGSEPLHCSSVGKTLLAFAPDELRDSLLSALTLEARTDRTITEVDRLSAELDRVRRQGYATDDEELSVGIRCVAVPIRNSRGSYEYALGASGATGRMTPAKLDRVVALMLHAARDIHSQL
jgi:DNA-binding IclR family transcriptional regulator